MKYAIAKLKHTTLWCVLCPDGDLYFEDTFTDAVERMNIHAMDRAVAA